MRVHAVFRDVCDCSEMRACQGCITFLSSGQPVPMLHSAASTELLVRHVHDATCLLLVRLVADVHGVLTTPQVVVLGKQVQLLSRSCWLWGMACQSDGAAHL